MTARIEPEFHARSLAVVMVVMVAVALSGAQFAATSISVFLSDITSDYNWSRAQISGAVTMLYIGMAAAAPLFGILFDRYGPRTVMLPLTLVSGLIIASFAMTGASLILFYAAHLLLGIAQPGMVAYSKTISTWFARRRALALSAIAVGILISQISVPPLARLLLETLGWHQTYIVFGAIEIFVALPLLALFFHDRSASPAATANTSEEIVVRKAPSGDFISLKHVLTMPIYWHLVATQVCVAFCFLSITVHAVGILTERGVEPATAVWGLSTFAVGGLAAKLVIGLLLDSIDTPKVIAPFALISLLSLLVIQFGKGEVLGLSAMFAFGFGCIACGPMAYLTTRYFGVASFSTIYGSTVPIMTLLGSGSPVLAGLIYDLTGSYDLMLTAANLAMFAGFILFLTLPRYPFSLKQTNDPTPAGSIL